MNAEKIRYWAWLASETLPAHRDVYLNVRGNFSRAFAVLYRRAGDSNAARMNVRCLAPGAWWIVCELMELPTWRWPADRMAELDRIIRSAGGVS